MCIPPDPILTIDSHGCHQNNENRDKGNHQPQIQLLHPVLLISLIIKHIITRVIDNYYAEAVCPCLVHQNGLGGPVEGELGISQDYCLDSKNEVELGFDVQSQRRPHRTHIGLRVDVASDADSIVHVVVILEDD